MVASARLRLWWLCLLLLLSPLPSLQAAQDTKASGSLTAAEQAVTLNMPAVGSVAFQVTGTFSLTLTFEASVNAADFVSVPATNLATGAKATTTTATGIYVVHAPGARYIRSRVSSFTSGTAVVFGNATLAPLQVGALGTAAAGSTVADTELPAAAAGADGVASAGVSLPGIFSYQEIFDATAAQYNRIRSAGSIPDAAGLGATAAAAVMQKVGTLAWDHVRTPNVFKVVALGAGTTETTIWDPAAGKKFRLMGFLLTSGAASTLIFRDNTAGTTIFRSRGTADVPYSPSDMGNGILSSTADNLLTVERLTSSTLDGVVWGVEE